MTDHDFNALELAADRLVRRGEHRKALAIYYSMADGDRSLDAGRLAERIAECYRDLGELHAAKYWYGRAAEENPQVYASCLERVRELGDLDLTPILERKP